LTELAVAIGVPAEDRSKFHRNLQNWQYYSVLPRRYDGMEVPQVDDHGGQIGSEAFYPPVFIPMLDRLNKLREQYPKDMDEWRCRLWLDGYPAPYIEWCRELLCSWVNPYTVATWADLPPTAPGSGTILSASSYRVCGKSTGCVRCSYPDSSCCAVRRIIRAISRWRSVYRQKTDARRCTPTT
jgi:hypothetical protein